MIKRYGFGLRAISVGHGESVKLPDIVEQADGDYVRYEGYLALSEAIGAGGVGSERITRQGKSREQHRAEFEAWISNGYQWLRRIERHPDNPSGYAELEAGVAWKAWKAARGIKETKE